MQTIERPAHRIDEAQRPLWFGGMPRAWGDVFRTIDPNDAQDSASDAAGLGWSVEQCPLEAVLAIGDDGYPTRRAHVPRHVANVRSDTGAVLGVVGEGYEPLQNGAAFGFCDDITDSGRANCEVSKYGGISGHIDGLVALGLLKEVGNRYRPDRSQRKLRAHLNALLDELDRVPDERLEDLLLREHARRPTNAICTLMLPVKVLFRHATCPQNLSPS